MGFFSWIIFGAIAGWAASVIMGRGKRMGCITNIIVGVLGASIGGFIMNLVGNEVTVTGFNMPSFIVAVLGAIVLLAITGWWQEKK